MGHCYGLAVVGVPWTEEASTESTGTPSGKTDSWYSLDWRSNSSHDGNDTRLHETESTNPDVSGVVNPRHVAQNKVVVWTDGWWDGPVVGHVTYRTLLPVIFLAPSTAIDTSEPEATMITSGVPASGSSAMVTRMNQGQ